jgi:hypothetical protein
MIQHAMIRKVPMRAIIALLQSLINRLYGKQPDGLTAVEYEAITLIAQEGRGALARAREQAAYCRRRGSEQGHAFWMGVAEEVSRRTKGSADGTRRSTRERKGTEL